MEPAHDRAADAWPYRTMPPERYAALYAHRLGHLGLEEWTHRPEVYDWLVAVDAICRDPERLAQCRAECLSAEERRDVEGELRRF
jgi:hypothetical protein